MHNVQIVLWHCERLTYHATYGILCSFILQSLGVSEEYRRHEFNFSHEHGRVYYPYFRDRSHETERVSAANQLYLYVDLVEHETLLEERSACIRPIISNSRLCLANVLRLARRSFTAVASAKPTVSILPAVSL